MVGPSENRSLPFAHYSCLVVPKFSNPVATSRHWIYYGVLGEVPSSDEATNTPRQRRTVHLFEYTWTNCRLVLTAKPQIGVWRWSVNSL